jgi:hypothetical protein
MYTSFSAIIALWPSVDLLAADLGEKPATVRKWKQRNKIPPEHWVGVVRSAQVRGYEGVTADVLAAVAAGRGDCKTCANYLAPEDVATVAGGEAVATLDELAIAAALEPRDPEPPSRNN